MIFPAPAAPGGWQRVWLLPDQELVGLMGDRIFGRAAVPSREGWTALLGGATGAFLLQSDGSFVALGDYVDGVATPDGRYLLAWNAHRAALFDGATGALVASRDGGHSGVTTVKFFEAGSVVLERERRPRERFMRVRLSRLPDISGREIEADDIVVDREARRIAALASEPAPGVITLFDMTSAATLYSGPAPSPVADGLSTVFSDDGEHVGVWDEDAVWVRRIPSGSWVRFGEGPAIAHSRDFGITPDGSYACARGATMKILARPGDPAPPPDLHCFLRDGHARVFHIPSARGWSWMPYNFYGGLVRSHVAPGALSADGSIAVALEVRDRRVRAVVFDARRERTLRRLPIDEAAPSTDEASSLRLIVRPGDHALYVCGDDAGVECDVYHLETGARLRKGVSPPDQEPDAPVPAEWPPSLPRYEGVALADLLDRLGARGRSKDALPNVHWEPGEVLRAQLVEMPPERMNIRLEGAVGSDYPSEWAHAERAHALFVHQRGMATLHSLVDGHRLAFIAPHGAKGAVVFYDGGGVEIVGGAPPSPDLRCRRGDTLLPFQACAATCSVERGVARSIDASLP